MLKNSLWIVDAATVSAALTQALTEPLHCPVQSVSPTDLPAASEAPALALMEMLLPDACGLTLAARLRAQTGAVVAVWSTRPAPVYAWVAWQVGLNGCLDKALAWEDTLTLIHGLLNGAAVWPTDVWENVREFEAGVGQRLCEKLGVADEAEAKQLAWSAGLVKMHAEPVWSDALMLYIEQNNDLGLGGSEG